MRTAFLILLFVVLALCAFGLSSCSSSVTIDPATGARTETKNLDPAAAVLIGQGLQTYAEIKRPQPQPKVERSAGK